MTHSFSDWVAVLSLGTGITAAVSIPVLLLADAEPGDFDPRPAVRRAVESGRFDRVLIVVANAKYDARTAVREAAVSAAALLMLLSPASEARS
jgi:hypothetical protein